MQYVTVCWWYSIYSPYTIFYNPNWSNKRRGKWLSHHILTGAWIYLFFYSDINRLFNKVFFYSKHLSMKRGGATGKPLHNACKFNMTASVLLAHILPIKPTAHLTACLYKEAPSTGAWQGQIRESHGKEVVERESVVGRGLIRLPWPRWFIDSFVCLFRNPICIIHVRRWAVLRTLAG